MALLLKSITQLMPDKRVVWFNKEDIEKLIEDGVLKHQQGGAAAELDDWFSMGKNSTLLINHELAKSLDEF